MADIPHDQALEPLRCVISDVRSWDPCLDSTIDAFYMNVERRARTRGWKSILLLDLPALGKAYDSALSSGRLNFGDVPACFGKLGPENFDGSWIFRSLLQHSLDGFGTLDQTTPVEVVAATRQLLYLYKNLSISCPEQAVKDAVEDYISIEGATRAPSGTWNSDQWIHCRVRFSDSDELRGFRELPNKFWRLLDMVFGFTTPSGFLCPEDIVPKHGPGAVSDVRRGGDKYAFPAWPSKLERLFPDAQFAYANEYVGLCEPLGISRREPPARLLAVPKTFKGPRLIASEPTAHQFLQQGLMQWLRDHLPQAIRTCVNFLDQRPSRAAALEASRTGDLATVDLSSASDRLSCWVVERAFGSNQTLLAALHACRTRVIVDGTGTHPDLSLRLRKFAAQGSAVTFPVQSIVYATVAITAALYDDGVTRPSASDVNRYAAKVRVFGDDIICPSPNVPTLRAALTGLGLKVNDMKTHDRGLFRESCGMDAYRGHDVTPGYIRDLQLKPDADSFSSWIEVSNNFHMRGLWQLAWWMLRAIPSKEASGILTSDHAGPGIRVLTFCRGTRFHGKVRWNPDLHRQEARVLCLRSSAERRARGSFQDLHQYFVEAPHPETTWSAGVPGRNSLTLVREWVDRNT